MSLKRKKKTSSKRYLGRTYNVTEDAIRKIWQNKEEIKKRCAEMSEECRNKKTQGCSPEYPELESIIIYEWITPLEKLTMRHHPQLCL